MASFPGAGRVCLTVRSLGRLARWGLIPATYDSGRYRWTAASDAGECQHRLGTVLSSRLRWNGECAAAASRAAGS